MQKIINFFKTHYFLTGLILLITGFILAWIRGALLIKANIDVGYGWLKLIIDTVWVISLLFFVYSVIKEEFTFKIFSTGFIFLVSILLIQDIFFEMKYGIQSYKDTYKDVTNEYNQCIDLIVKATKDIPSDLPPSCVNLETCQKRNDVLTKFVNEIQKEHECEDAIFGNKHIIVY